MSVHSSGCSASSAAGCVHFCAGFMDCRPQSTRVAYFVGDQARCVFTYVVNGVNPPDTSCCLVSRVRGSRQGLVHGCGPAGARHMLGAKHAACLQHTRSTVLGQDSDAPCLSVLRGQHVYSVCHTPLTVMVPLLCAGQQWGPPFQACLHAQPEPGGTGHLHRQHHRTGCVDLRVLRHERCHQL
jgi:hypothetical protein